MGLWSEVSVWYFPTADRSRWEVSNFAVCAHQYELKKLCSQLEAPDPWLQNDNPWELPRADVKYEIRFYGHSERIDGESLHID